MFTKCKSGRLIQIVFILTLGACATDPAPVDQPQSSQESQEDEDDERDLDGCTGCRVVAPPPSIPMVMLDTEIDRSWPRGNPRTILHLDLTPSRSPRTKEAVLSYERASGDPGTGHFTLPSSGQGRSHAIIIQFDGPDGVFRAQMGSRRFRAKGSGNDSQWKDGDEPKVTLTEHGSGDDHYVKILIERGTAKLEFTLWNTELGVHACKHDAPAPAK